MPSGQSPTQLVSENPPRREISATMRARGFLPAEDPLIAFPPGSEFAVLDEVGRDLAEPSARPRIPRLCAHTQDSTVAAGSR